MPYSPLVARSGLLDLDPGTDADGDLEPPLTSTEVAAASSSVSVLRHLVTYTYPGPVSRMQQRLVVVPRRSHGDQQRVEHRFRVMVDDNGHPSSLHSESDAFGNTIISVHVHAINVAVQFETRAVISRVLNDSTASWPLSRLSWPTALTDTSDGIRRLARRAPETGDNVARATYLMHALREQMTYGKGATTVKTPASQALKIGEGVCQDMAHVLISACREAGIPARYVSGHLVGEGASHAWMEVHDPVSGRVVALDPTHDRTTDLRYVTVAVGRDYSEVSPTAGSVWSDFGAGGKLVIEKQFRVVSVL